ncbi:restriction endonuclease subunit S [Neisseria perflava]|uniref:restriction endonuclease subunit S n=1 Tax=Neisseria perflava TaxID=33053 RepID=UPI00201AE832|nr:restriction endonuclease subunit S [Neisseria perflava]MCL5078357.1 restriction endonuclease subunit S [Neisseria perflava]
MNKQQEPRLRFQGFTGEWKTEGFESVGEFNPKAEIPQIFQYVDLESVVGTQLISYREEFKETAPSRAQRLAKNVDLFFQAVRPYQKNNYLFEKNNENFVFSTGYIQIRPQNDGYFLLTLVQKEEFVQEVLLRCTGTSYPAINTSSLQNIAILLPPTAEEQAHLGNFFRRLDSQIAESRTVLEKSRQLKKAMLAKMFPANGEKIPKIRFKGFEGEWERNELGCLGYCLSGIGFSENEQGGENGIPFFKVSDMNLSGNEVYLRKANNYVTQEQIDKQRWQVIQQLPCIFFAKVGAALLLNRKRLVNTPFLLDNNTMAFILDSSLDNYFMKTLFDTIDLPALAQIGALPSINAKDIEKNIVFIPTPKEQSAIGNFFRQLDETIALQSAEVEKLNQLKKGLLAVMLV